MIRTHIDLVNRMILNEMSIADHGNWEESKDLVGFLSDSLENIRLVLRGIS